MINTGNEARAYELRQEGHTWDTIGKQLGVSRKTARRLHDKYQPSIKFVSNNVVNIERFQPLHIYGNAIVSCDWHIPLYCPDMVNVLLEKANKADIDTLIIGGDYFNQDSLSHFLPHQPDAQFDLEREEANKIMEVLLQVFKRVVFSWGNHDFRIVRKLDYVLDFEYCMKWILAGLGEERLSRIEFTNLDYLIYHPGPYDIRICHQQNFSKVPLTVPRQLAQKHNMSILCAHSHHFAQGVALDGHNLIFEGGGLFDSHKTEYIQRTNLHHQWVQGFYLFKDGNFTAYSPIYNNI